MTPSARPVVYVNGQVGRDEIQRQMHAATPGRKPGETLQEYAARRPQIVRTGVEKIIRRLEGADAFDVLELLRNREVLAPNLGYQEDRTPGNTKTIEIIATALLARGARTVGEKRADAAQRAMEMLHIVGAEIGTVGVFSALADSRAADDPWARLAANFRLARLSIRNLHYRSIDDAIGTQLFAQGSFAEELSERLGFTWEQFVAVRSAVIEHYSTNLFGAFDELADETRQLHEAGVTPSNDERERLSTLVASVMTRPGQRASFTTEHISERSGVSISLTTEILDLFSVGFEEADAVDAVEAYLAGETQFTDATLIRDQAGNYLQLALEIGDDNFRQVIERSLGRDAIAQLYNEHRRDISEAVAGEYLRRILAVAPIASAYYYYAEKDGFTASDLGAGASEPTVAGKECEGDLLFVIDDVAICVEVKGSSFSRGARSTRADFFENEVKKTIGVGAEQARRVGNLIRRNGGLWRRDRTWLDLKHVREVRTIVVTLDDLGPLSTEIADLDAAGVMPRDCPSWIVSAYDLAIIADLIDDPSEFLLYLRRRTDPESATRWRVVDELDLVMHFFHTALEHQPDPARIIADYPDAPAAGLSEQILWDDQPPESRIHDYTTTMLNPWYEYQQGDGPPAQKPALSVDPDVAKLVRAFATSRIPGAAVAGADLLGLTVAQRHTLRELVTNAQSQVVRTRGGVERLSLAGTSGASAVVVRSAPPGVGAKELSQKMREDFRSTLKEWGCDRVLGVAIGRSGSPVMMGYQSETVDAEFSALRPTAPFPPATRKPKKKAKSRRAGRSR